MRSPFSRTIDYARPAAPAFAGSSAGKAVVTALVLLSTVMALAALIGRLRYSGLPAYNFLFKDLFLAWVPLGLALAVAALGDGNDQPRWVAAPLSALVGVWMLFLPNAPYLLTEFVHLTTIHSPASARAVQTGLSSALNPGRGSFVPVWYDVLMLLLFAWNGLLLGLLSLRMVQQVIRGRLGKRWGWAVALAGVFLSAFGVTLGRFERFNSWDLFSKPDRLLREVARRVFHPLAYPRTAGATLLLTGLLLVAYLTAVVLLDSRPTAERR